MAGAGESNDGTRGDSKYTGTAFCVGASGGGAAWSFHGVGKPQAFTIGPKLAHTSQVLWTPRQSQKLTELLSDVVKRTRH